MHKGFRLKNNGKLGFIETFYESRFEICLFPKSERRKTNETKLKMRRRWRKGGRKERKKERPKSGEGRQGENGGGETLDDDERGERLTQLKGCWVSKNNSCQLGYTWLLL